MSGITFFLTPMPSLKLSGKILSMLAIKKRHLEPERQ